MARSFEFKLFTRTQIIVAVIFLLISFFGVVVNINSATSIERDRQTIINQIQAEQNTLITNKNSIEDQILEEIKRKNKTSIDERVNPEDVISIQRLPRVKEMD